MNGNGGLVTVFGLRLRRTPYGLALARQGYRVRAAVAARILRVICNPWVHQADPRRAGEPAISAVPQGCSGGRCGRQSGGDPGPPGRQTFEALHVDGARCRRAAREAGAKRFVHVLGHRRRQSSSSAYGRTKALGERAVLEEFPGAIIIRPSIIFGLRTRSSTGSRPWPPLGPSCR